jgi:hypothetical protein
VELVLNADDGIVSISDVHRDKGACEAGVHKNSRLVKVGNLTVSSVTRDATPAGGRKITCDEALDRVAKLLKGEKGSHVEVQIDYFSKISNTYFSKAVKIVRK